MKFSQRAGISAVTNVTQVDSIDDELRNSLWNALTDCYWDRFDRYKFTQFNERDDYVRASNLGELFKALWLHHFKKPIDEIPKLYYGESNGLGVLRTHFFQAKWYEVYDFVEFVCLHGPEGIRTEFIENCNYFLDRENSGYRFVDARIIEISSSEEINEIENAIERSSPYHGVKQHLKIAVTLLTDREKPDYRNSIKESISAVESLCKMITANKKATLGTALKVLEEKSVIHPALKSAFSALYGYTSNANGIRHALIGREHPFQC